MTHAELRILEVNKERTCALLEMAGGKKILNTIVAIETYDTRQIHRKAASAPLPKMTALLKALSTFYMSTGMQATLQEKGGFMQVQQEDRHAVLRLYIPPGKDKGKTPKEFSVSLKPSECEHAREWLRMLGMKRESFRQKHEVTYDLPLLHAQCSITTWPGVPPYLTLSGRSRAAIVTAATRLGFTVQQLDSVTEPELLKRYSASPIYLSFDMGHVEIGHTELAALVRQTALARAPHLSEKDLQVITTHYINAEYKGKRTHGLRKFCWDAQFYADRLGTPEIIKENAAMALLDGKREIGPLAAQRCTDIVISKAKKQGIALVTMTGAQRFGTLASWTEQIAKAGLIGIVTVSTEPFTALPETAKGVLGTNPLSIAVPYRDCPLVYDAALSKAPINTIWLNKLLGMELPDETFIDSTGNYTNDPQRAQYVDVFGGHKGAGLGLMLQILSGPLMGMASHTSFEDSYKNGFYFQAIDPLFFQTRENFNALVADLIASIKKAPLRRGFSEPFLPGEQSNDARSQTSQRRTVTVSKATIAWMTFLRDTNLQ